MVPYGATPRSESLTCRPRLSMGSPGKTRPRRRFVEFTPFPWPWGVPQKRWRVYLRENPSHKNGWFCWGYPLWLRKPKNINVLGCSWDKKCYWSFMSMERSGMGKYGNHRVEYTDITYSHLERNHWWTLMNHDHDWARICSRFECLRIGCVKTIRLKLWSVPRKRRGGLAHCVLNRFLENASWCESSMRRSMEMAKHGCFFHIGAKCWLNHQHAPNMPATATFIGVSCIKYPSAIQSYLFPQIRPRNPMVKIFWSFWMFMSLRMVAENEWYVLIIIDP